VGSFRIAIWVRDPAGTRKTTSDAPPLPDIRQRFLWPDSDGVPAIAAAGTSYYEASWSCTAPGNASLRLASCGDSPRSEVQRSSSAPCVPDALESTTPMQTRKPVLLLRYPGLWLARFAERQNHSLENWPPPRST